MLYRRVVVAPTFAEMIILGIIEDQAAIREALGTCFGAQPEFMCGLRLSVHTDAGRAFEAPRQGAVGYLEKTTPLPLLTEHLLQVAAGGSPMSPRVARHFQPQPAAPRPGLTPREADIGRGIEDGLSYKLIAERLGLRPDTVRSHLRQVYRKLEVHSKTEIIAKTPTRLA